MSVLVLFALSARTFAYAAKVTGESPPLQLVWSDEFDYNGPPDPSKWAYETGGGGWGNDEKEYYTDRIDNCRVEDGHLVIEVKKEKFEDNEYTSARIHTLGDGWKYGRIDIRAKLTGGSGTWPAIWMVPTHPQYGSLGWPDNGEIDIMEYAAHDPGNVLGSIYSKNHIWYNDTGLSVYKSVPDAETAYHTYSINWSEETVELMIDGVTYNAFPNPKTSWEDWPFDQQYRLIINIAVGGWGGDDVDDSALPQSLLVDYVRVYQSPAQVTSNTRLM